MLKVNILSVGRIKEEYYLQAVAEYVKRLGRFCTVQETVIGEIVGENNLEKEAEKILPLLKGKVVVLDKEGKNYTSEQLACWLGETMNGCSQITFVIGSSFGLADKIKKKADYTLSFSQLTLPHSLAKVFLCEQLYRAFCIKEGSKYHK